VSKGRRLHIYPLSRERIEIRCTLWPDSLHRGPIRCTVWTEAKKIFVLELPENTWNMIGWHSLFGVLGFRPCPETDGFEALCGLSSFSHVDTGVNITVHECDLYFTFPVLLVDAAWPAIRVASLNKP